MNRKEEAILTLFDKSIYDDKSNLEPKIYIIIFSPSKSSVSSLDQPLILANEDTEQRSIGT
jgi:hypothetical protein